MKKNYKIGEAAKIVGTTAETLRHCDRIGLVKPRTDEWTGYRYYTQSDIVLLNTVMALRQMDLQLSEIKSVLEYDDLDKIVDFLINAEKKADEKLAHIEFAKSKISAARADYVKKLRGRRSYDGAFTLDFPERVIMLSDTLSSPEVDNLYNYLAHFYDKISPDVRNKFIFEDMAGIYTKDKKSYLFAVCVTYENADGLKVLPAGKYLCADCCEKDRSKVSEMLLKKARQEYNAAPDFVVEQIIVSGILQWNYRVQVFTGKVYPY